MSNRIIISAAGSGKTTYLVNEAIKIKNSSVLITTYTEANETEIKRKIYQNNGCIPSNITVMTWFTFLLKHGVRPYQDTLDSSLNKKKIGFYLSNMKSGYRYTVNDTPIYWGEKDFNKYYFSKDMKIFSDKISHFILQTNLKCDNQVFERIGKIFSNIFIDEVQDLVGYDYDILNHLFNLSNNVLLVGDPRQVTYLTHPTTKYKKYRDGKLILFIRDVINLKETKCIIDKETLRVSHRNNKEICDYSSKLFPSLPIPKPCHCCHDYSIEHQGVFLVRPINLNQYIAKYKPIQIRWNRNVAVSQMTSTINMGESKGLTFNRTIIFPTKTIENWIKDNNSKLKSETAAKFYVALTRARYSTAIVLDYKEAEEFSGLQKYSPRSDNEQNIRK